MNHMEPRFKSIRFNMKYITDMTGKLNNTLLEILKVFSQPLSDQQLKEVKRLLFEFKVKHIVKDMDKNWEGRDIYQDDLLKEHMRTS